MKKILFIVLFFISAGNCFGQQVTFQKTFGGIGADFAVSIQQTTDGGYIIIGTTYSFGAGNIDVYLIRTDAYGDTLWTKTFGGAADDRGWSVQQTTDGGYIITGRKSGFGSHDVYLIKTDANGNSLWSKTFGGTNDDEGYSVHQTTDGGYIITGITNSLGTGSLVYLIRTDANGDSLWTKTFGGIGGDYGRSVQQTMDGGYILAGYTYSFGAGADDVYIIKTDANGNSLWSKTFGGNDDDYGLSVQQTIDGGYIIAGYTYSFGAGTTNVYFIKTNANGDSLWTKTFGGTSNDRGYSVQQTADGGYVIAGFTSSFGAGNYDIYLIKTDSNGDSLWIKTFGGTDYEEAHSIQQTSDGGYVIAGYTGSFGTNGDVYLIKTDSLGNSGCNEGNTATIITTPATQVSSPATIVASPATIVTTPATIVASGGTVTTLCTTVGINPIFNFQFSIFNISPNPTTNNFTITFPNTIHKGSIEIYTILGKKIFNENIFNSSQKEIHLKNGAAGIYFVKVRDGEKEYGEKLVIEN
ncbi:MAG TPA: T9SS type A sorting domain-containing protein [Bacteroidia bacterium]|nr:T9SS type A sorting domain-containing protein [Bacteroidia bacterium]